MTGRSFSRVAACAAAVAWLTTAGPAFADIFIYWQGFGGTWQVGSLGTTGAVVATEDNTLGTSSEPASGSSESHMAIVCSKGQCGIVGDCKACHVAPKPVRTFAGRVMDEHRRTHFPRATIAVGSAPVPYEQGFVQLASGRIHLLDQDRTPTYRLPAGARLLKDTRTGQPLFIVYDGRTAPEPIRR